ncbi:DUF4387 family protein [Cupriavidus oxalaticus]|uniref:DUF4387 family protein n=1 Tax=Cupriavidus oxalaticus TaxID=96344 RepID=A0A4P7LK41_9BURK|nr:DUF4387 family protein [Cupriavidus oxalaticus]QBY56195.1 DUF4387 family protein [Cupriavidus oxalaticus]
MTKLRDVTRNVRSKNAGPFWVTIDISFDGSENFRAYHESSAIGAAAIGAAFGVDPALVKHFPVPDLNVLKISYPRQSPQGGIEERDMHCGQQYARLLEADLG